MDRRKARSRNEIFTAFLDLLKDKRYTNISVKDIIERANVGRATFYNHFDTKDDLLEEFCQELFEHIFTPEGIHDLPIELDSRYTLEQRLTHIYYHFKKSKKDMLSILKSEDADIFWRIFVPYIKQLFDLELRDSKLPNSYLESFYAGSFIETIKWWLNENMQTSEKLMAQYFIDAAKLEVKDDTRE